MKRFFAIITVVMMCISLAVPALAAQEFMPSVTNKPAPEIVPVPDGDGNLHIGIIRDKDGKIISYVDEGCLIITPVSEVDTSTEIPEPSRVVLKDVYGKLTNGSMTIPYEKHNAKLDSSKMVIRDLFDATFVCEEHPKMLEPEGVTLELIFKLDVKAGANVYAMTYKENAWDPIVSCVNNGNGTVTCVFEKLCPIEFSISTATTPPATTGDLGNMSLWGIVAIVSLLAIVALTVVYRMDAKKRA